MILCYEKKKFLYEARPDLFPYNRLTGTEQKLWDFFYTDLEQRQKNG